MQQKWRPGDVTDRAEGTAATRHYLRGICLILLAGLFLSSGGLLVRHIEQADGWQILFYRSLSFTVMLFVFTVWQHRRGTVGAYQATGWPGILVALFIGLNFTVYVFGMLNTTVANVSFIRSVNPFMAAFLAWLVLGERVRRSLFLAMGAAALGVAIMFVDGIESGHTTGNLIALGLPASFAVVLVALRSAADRDMTPATCLGGLVSVSIAFAMAGDLTLSASDLLLSVLFGTVQLCLGFLLITVAARWVPAAQVALLMLAEVTLTPIWVWLLLGERPTDAALFGGLIVLAAVMSQGLLAVHSARSTPERS